MTILYNHMLPSQFTHSLKTSSPIRSNYWGHYMKPTQTRHKENLSNLPSFFHSLIPPKRVTCNLPPPSKKKNHMASWNIPILNTRDTSSFMVVFFSICHVTPPKKETCPLKNTWFQYTSEPTNHSIFQVDISWLVVSTHLKTIRQNGFIFPKVRDENSKTCLSSIYGLSTPYIGDGFFPNFLGKFPVMGI